MDFLTVSGFLTIIGFCFSFLRYFLFLVTCGRLSWLPVSFWMLDNIVKINWLIFDLFLRHRHTETQTTHNISRSKQAILTNQVYEARSCEPDTDESGHKLCKTNAVGRLEYVEILQNVWNRHQTKTTSKPQTCHVYIVLTVRTTVGYCSFHGVNNE